MRRSIAVPIGLDGKRDAGKVFHITELHTEQFEGWLCRAILGLAQAGVTVPLDVVAAGVAGLATLNPTHFQMVPWLELEPLLSAMLPSFTIAAPTGAAARPIVPGDIAELATLWRLRVEWLSLHLDPLGPASLMLPPAPAQAPQERDRRPAKRARGRGHHAPGHA
ncbi:MAG: hypothetical protein ACRYHQ_23210 [Janthinobacterium lividum]